MKKIFNAQFAILNKFSMKQFSGCLKYWNFGSLIGNWKLGIGNSRRGFTMIELMVTIGIFALITGAVLTNFRGGERAEELRNSAENVKSLLNEVRNMTLTGRVETYKSSISSIAPKSGMPIGGYGIAITRDTITQRYQYSIIAIDAVSGTAEYQQGGQAIWSVGTSNRFPPSIALAFVPTAFSMITFEPLTGNMVFRTGGGAIIDVSPGTITATHTALPGQKRSVILDRVSGRISTE